MKDFLDHINKLDLNLNLLNLIKENNECILSINKKIVMQYFCNKDVISTDFSLEKELSYGKCILSGLGMGILTNFLLKNEKIKKVIVYEINNDVIKLYKMLNVENSKLTIFEGNTIYADSKDKNTINFEVQKIMYYYKEEVEKNKCKPNDFLIVTPFTKKNPLVEALHLEIREFWKNYYKSDNYVHYSVFHKSEDGTTIDLDESTNSTRISRSR